MHPHNNKNISANDNARVASNGTMSGIQHEQAFVPRPCPPKNPATLILLGILENAALREDPL